MKHTTLFWVYAVVLFAGMAASDYMTYQSCEHGKAQLIVGKIECTILGGQ